MTYFNLDDDVIYLNHAAVAPWPSSTAAAVAAFATENARRGSQHYEHWLQTEAGLRRKLQQLINAASSDEIALLKSTSEGLSKIAWGLCWQAGENIVIPAGEFPSNRIVWESLSSLGVSTKQVAINDIDRPEQTLIDALDEHTRLLSVSSVQYASGLRLDLAQLGDACRQRDILFCVDAIQSIGALQFDVQAIQADFVVADGHKWMLGPEGLALFYCRQALIDSLVLNEFGWHMLQSPGDFDRQDWLPAIDASRFECGSPNMLTIHALNASLDVLFDVGMQRIEAQVLENSGKVIELLLELDGVELLSPPDPQRRAGIVTFRRNGVDSEALYSHLQQSGVICALRGGGIRFSPHFYTEQEKISTAIQLVAAFSS
jgi:cysteine desulfurase / selenocysteine lyase